MHLSSLLLKVESLLKRFSPRPVYIDRTMLHMTYSNYRRVHNITQAQYWGFFLPMTIIRESIDDRDEHRNHDRAKERNQTAVDNITGSITFLSRNS